MMILLFADGASENNATPVKIEYELHPNSTGVCITCTFLDNSTTECVVVVHQRTSQIGSSGLMNIESSHRFYRSRSGNTAYGCIKGVVYMDMKYQIGVLDGERAIEKHDIVHTEGIQGHSFPPVHALLLILFCCL